MLHTGKACSRDIFLKTPNLILGVQINITLLPRAQPEVVVLRKRYIRSESYRREENEKPGICCPQVRSGLSLMHYYSRRLDTDIGICPT